MTKGPQTLTNRAIPWGRRILHISNNVCWLVLRGNPIGKGLGSLDHTGLEVSNTNLLVSLIPKTLDASWVRALGQVWVPLGIGEQSFASQLQKKKCYHFARNSAPVFVLLRRVRDRKFSNLYNFGLVYRRPLLCWRLLICFSWQAVADGVDPQIQTFFFGYAFWTSSFRFIWLALCLILSKYLTI